MILSSSKNYSLIFLTGILLISHLQTGLTQDSLDDIPADTPEVVQLGCVTKNIFTTPNTGCPASRDINSYTM